MNQTQTQQEPGTQQTSPNRKISTPYLNYGYTDGISDIANNRPRKWDSEGKYISVSWKKFNGKMGKSFVHFNNEYIVDFMTGYHGVKPGFTVYERDSGNYIGHFTAEQAKKFNTDYYVIEPIKNIFVAY